MKKLLTAAVALVLTSDAALAISFGLPGTNTPQPAPQATPVPEISAVEGTAAVAAIASVMLIVWERRRRAG